MFVNNLMQFNRLHWNNTTAVVSMHVLITAWLVKYYIVLLLYIHEQLNKQAPNNERNIVS